MNNVYLDIYCLLQLTYTDILGIVNYDKTKSRTNQTFTFYLDTMTVSLVTHSTLVYTIWDYIYEIGGWVGLFLGYSFIGIYDDVVRILYWIVKYRPY